MLKYIRAIANPDYKDTKYVSSITSKVADEALKDEVPVEKMFELSTLNDYSKIVIEKDLEHYTKKLIKALAYKIYK